MNEQSSFQKPVPEAANEAHTSDPDVKKIFFNRNAEIVPSVMCVQKNGDVMKMHLRIRMSGYGYGYLKIIHTEVE
jgi:hypothetical protein